MGLEEGRPPGIGGGPVCLPDGLGGGRVGVQRGPPGKGGGPLFCILL